MKGAISSTAGVAGAFWFITFKNFPPAWGFWLVLAIVFTVALILQLLSLLLVPTEPAPEELIDWSPASPRADVSSKD